MIKQCSQWLYLVLFFFLVQKTIFFSCYMQILCLISLFGVCSCLVYYPFLQGYFPLLWIFWGDLQKRLKDDQLLKPQCNNHLVFRITEIKLSWIQHQVQYLSLRYHHPAFHQLIVNTQVQTWCTGKVQKSQRKNFLENLNVCKICTKVEEINRLKPSSALSNREKERKKEVGGWRHGVILSYGKLRYIYICNKKIILCCGKTLSDNNWAANLYLARFNWIGYIFLLIWLSSHLAQNGHALSLPWCLLAGSNDNEDELPM